MGPNNGQSFENVQEWLEAFTLEPSVEMREGMLKAFMNNKNFGDQTNLTRHAAPNTRVNVILQAMTATNGKKISRQTVALAVEILLTQVLTGKGFTPWPSSTKKANILKVLKWLKNMSKKKYAFSYEYTEKFLSKVLREFAPDENSPRENAEIIRAVIDLGHSELLVRIPMWRGNQVVIKMLLKTMDDVSDPFSMEHWQYQKSEQLAIHMAVAGGLKDYIQKLKTAVS